MTNYIENIANATRITWGDFAGRKDGCIESAMVVLGGDVEAVRFEGRLRRRGEITDDMTTSGTLRFVGLRREVEIIPDSDIEGTITKVEAEFRNVKARGLLVIAENQDDTVHAFAVVHGRNYPFPNGEETDLHTIVDTSIPEYIRPGQTVRQIVEGLQPKKQSFIWVIYPKEE